MASVKAAILEMHMTQAADRAIEAWEAAAAVPWWDPFLRWIHARRARGAERELEIWRERLHGEESGG